MLKNKKIFSILTLALMATVATIMVNMLIVAASPNIGWSEVTIAETYVMGDNFVIPERTYVSSEGESKAVTSLTYPDGKVEYISGSVKLEQYGSYLLTYTVIA